MHVGPQFSLVVDGPSAGRNVDRAVLGPVSSRAVTRPKHISGLSWPTDIMGLQEAESLAQASTGRIMRQAFNRPKVTLGLTVVTFITGR